MREDDVLVSAQNGYRSNIINISRDLANSPYHTAMINYTGIYLGIEPQVDSRVVEFAGDAKSYTLNQGRSIANLPVWLEIGINPTKLAAALAITNKDLSEQHWYNTSNRDISPADALHYTSLPPGEEDPEFGYVGPYYWMFNTTDANGYVTFNWKHFLDLKFWRTFKSYTTFP